jgi:hypothetical protein
MGSGFYLQLRKILLQHECRLIRQGKGSHEFWQSPINGRCFPVAITVNTRHTANAILKQAGIDQKV